MSDLGFDLPPVEATASGVRVGLELPPDCPWFAGHFPGRPILPAVAQLALVLEAARAAWGETLWIGGIRAFRALRPLVPGDRLVLDLAAPAADGAARFELACGDALASRGTVELRGVPG